MRSFFIVLLLLSCKMEPRTQLSVDQNSGIEITGYLEVPENRTSSKNKTIKLAYTVIKAKQDTPKKAPILYLQGGPGGPTLIMRQFWENNILREDRDIVLMDQRGTGLSNAICDDQGSRLIEILRMDLSPEGEYLEIKKALEACKKIILQKNMDLSGYNSRENAADFEALRKFLGYEQWNIYGGSYGSRLGLTIMRDYPKSVKSAVIFGVFAPEANLYSNLVSNFRQSLYGVFDACNNNPDCRQRYPEIKQKFMEVLTTLEARPYTFNYNGKPWVMNTQDFLLVLHQMLYSKTTIGQVPSLIKAMGEGNDNIIRNSLASTVNTANLINIAMYMSVNAYEELPFNDEASLQIDLTKNPELKTAPAFFGSDPKLLADWHPFRAEPIENEAVVSNIPTLLINGSLDPITPPANAVKAAESLSDSYYIEFENEGHGFFGPCFFEISKAFLNQPGQFPNTACIENIAGISWN